LFSAFIAFGFSDYVPKAFNGEVRDSFGRPTQNPIALGRMWFFGWLAPFAFPFGLTCIAAGVIRLLIG
jgi:hypothetical protein